MPFDRGEFGAASFTEDGLSSDKRLILDVFGNFGPPHSGRMKSQPTSQGEVPQVGPNPMKDILKDQLVHNYKATIRRVNNLVY